ncbi:hypothetical protein COM25_10200 [Bacillus wiedmannii]|uniref:Uncharacterized protein n=1 Tax=Bacillus wiedmannii TaxID=1890302 RepID=A0ABD6TSW7_9BACI|nr:hypothetical protein CN560_12375 [Bacillus wiedmannii]PEP14009.1 hypothetical protein CN552_16095 [Bacillus wiedmannii]PFX61643.1 hypothetical protein COL36_10620 [Bacillus wiedmannii]PGC75979.1 hypothetical protein COM25_10200 [Bacillus wiedmannii]PHB04926.1 hypothetical protein COE81_19860 [Bacillus wiedmannii]
MHFFIHSYYGTVLGFSFVTQLPKKLYKILHALSVGVSEMLAVPLLALIRTSTRVSFSSSLPPFLPGLKQSYVLFLVCLLLLS